MLNLKIDLRCATCGEPLPEALIKTPNEDWGKRLDGKYDLEGETNINLEIRIVPCGKCLAAIGIMEYARGFNDHP